MILGALSLRGLTRPPGCVLSQVSTTSHTCLLPWLRASSATGAQPATLYFLPASINYEIKFGDNDKLAALTAVLLDVDILIIATNTNGIYTKASIHDMQPETIRLVTDLQTLEKEIGEAKSSHGTGGMQSKIDSAAIAKAANIETWIINGLEDNFILKGMKGEIAFTKIV